MTGFASPKAGFPASPYMRSLHRPHNVDGHLVYAIGDIHGCYRQMTTLFQMISDDAATRAEDRNPILIFCGDYVDRGPDSAKVLDSLCWLYRHSPYELYFLKGNHEEVFAEYLRDPEQTTEWLRFGGAETLLSYGVTPPEADALPADHVRARDDLLEVMPVAHWRFLERLQLTVTIGDYAFVHAGVRPRQPLDRQTEEDMLWIRQGFVDFDGPHEKVIVHGHTWTSDAPDIQAHRIGIDTGAYESGVLTALCVEDGSIGILQARG